MFSNEKCTKIKNAKIQEWCLELSTLDYTIKYHLGEENVVPDTLSRAYNCSLINSSTLVDLHNGLCYPGITRLLHFEKKNLPFSTEDVKKRCVHAEPVLRLNLVSIFHQKALLSRPVLLKRFESNHKIDPYMVQVELLNSNLTYANIKYPSGRESTVSVYDLVSCPETVTTRVFHNGTK